ncbi:MAG TPA: histidine phosphatase family protein [Deltaproteobacteria bacterium]|nr:histidine phosphatase family protein [Deltaproteobacteria bacterium]
MSMIYLVRHGQASFGQDNYDLLSPLGKKQSRILAQFFLDTGLTPDALYSGALSRQQATAQEFYSLYQAQGKMLPDLELLDELNEYETSAIVTDLFPAMAEDDPSLHDDLERMYKDKESFKRVFEAAMLRWVSGNHATPGHEQWSAFVDRISRALKQIIRINGRGKTIVAFTSGGPIAASLVSVLGISGEMAMRLNWQIINTSYTRYMYKADRITLAGFNSIAHLELAKDPGVITYR